MKYFKVFIRRLNNISLSATRNRKVYAFGVLYFTLLIFLYLFPFSDQISLNRNQIMSFRGDHVMHLVVFSPIPVLLFFLFSKHPSISLIKVTLISLILALCFELSHAIVPYRSFTIDDLLANIAGVLVGVLLLVVFRIIYKD